MHASFFTARLSCACHHCLSCVCSESVILRDSIVLTFITAKRLGLLPAGCDRNVTVHSGDTCDKISAAHNVSTYQLATVNSKIIDSGCDNLGIGEVLCLGIKGQDCNVTHVLKGGETCHSVADATGVPEKTLLANNPNLGSDCSGVYPGEVLCTAKKIYVTNT
ncbi:uncharacterized protein F5147DRAFT_642039 [Suillus discolor]|uniref:LysM domain-containing protein n=1 Tax=Suillus discolor TaxID=1912936 RepID=A0A9P7EYL9_9AGAM|nr:uncharacterized protein F5147DRAFT_642039 [Suillus discolor]KAG2095429.1 hypothetical protein F5147DRAFT_642039 [Suillus discolor]